MQSGNNLSIQVSADSSKLRADLAKAQKDIRDFNKELRKATDIGDTAGIDKFSRQLDDASRAAAKLKRELRDTPAAVKETAGSFDTLTKSFGPLLERFESMRSAFLGIAGFEALRKGADILGDVSQQIREFVNQGKATGLEPTFLKAFKEGLEDAGATADVSKRAMIALTDAMAKARQASVGLSGAMNQGVQVFRGDQTAATDLGDQVRIMRGNVDKAAGSLGNMVSVGDKFIQVVRGGVKPVVDLSDPLKALGVNMSQFPDTTAGNRKALLDIIARLREIQKIAPQTATALGNQLFPKAWADIADAITNLDEAKLQRIVEELEKSGRAITPKSDEDAKAYNLALKNLGDAFEAIKMQTATALFPEIAKTIQADTADIEKLTELWNSIVETIGNSEGLQTAVTSVKQIVSSIFDPASYQAIWAQLGPAMQSVLDSMESAFALMWSNIKTAAQSFFDWISASLKSVVPSSVASAFSSAVVPQMASGGSVPGSGTGDTVRAMLTPGEFVVRKSAVAHYGTDMLRALNSQRYAMGGLVHRLHAPVRGFADGGMVSATTADGAIVNLHFPGGSFGLRGDKGIVAGLTREARRASMLSAGRAPGMA